MVKVDVKCSATATLPLDYNAAMTVVLEVNSCHAPYQLMKQFRVPCVFKSTGWGTHYLTPGEIGAALDLPPSLIPKLESAIASNSFQIVDLLALPPVKGLQFGLAVCCSVGLDNRLTPSV